MYCTVDDLRASQPQMRLVEATDDDNPNELGEFDVAKAEAMIELADGIIDGYIGARLSLPLPVVPKLINKISIDLTLHGLYERIGAAGLNSDMAIRRKNAISLLERIQDGKLSLGLPSSDSSVLESTSERALFSSGVAEFTIESMGSLGGNFR